MSNDDYTPSTDKVANRYAIGRYEYDRVVTGDAEFDRWLAKRDRDLRDQVVQELKAEAARLDALTITEQDRTATTVRQVMREGVLRAANIVHSGGSND